MAAAEAPARLTRTNSCVVAERAVVSRELARDALNHTNEDLDLAVQRLLKESPQAPEPFGELVMTRAALTRQEEPAILVGVRVRPPLKREMQGDVALVGARGFGNSRVFVTKSDKPVVVTSEGSITSSGDISAFTFDRVLEQGCAQSDVYELVAPVTESALRGVNGTVFAYGQTGSGKTYTMGEHWAGDERGIVPRCAEHLLAARGPGDAIWVQCIQLYNEQLTDLLTDSASVAIKLREGSDGQVYPEGAAAVELNSLAQLEPLLLRAQRRRATSRTDMNEMSSRSHLITTFIVERSGPNHGTSAQLHLVDLAGSERIKRSGATGERLKEACAINTSLQHLAEVVRKLLQRNHGSHSTCHIPYRNCTLTRLLSNSLGGNCRTLLLAMISASFDSATESIATLQFAQCFSNVKNKPVVNQRTPDAIKPWHTKPQIAPPKKKPQKRVMPWERLEIDEYGGVQVITTSLGELAVHVYGDIQSQPAVVLLHGYPSSALSCAAWAFGPLLSAGFCVIAPDMPGCGSSVGHAMINNGIHRSARVDWYCYSSEFNLDKGGAVDIVLAVLDTLHVTQATFFGSDWGGGICLSIALKCPNMVQRLVVMHANYAEKKSGELRRIVPKTLVLWKKQDNFHPWSKWQPLAKSIPNCTIKLMNQGYGKQQRNLTTDMIAHLLEFLVGRNPFEDQQSVQGALPEEAGRDVNGARVKIQPLIAVSDGSLGVEQSRQLFEESTAGITAIKQFRQILEAGQIDALMQSAAFSGSNASYTQAMRLFGSMPQLGPIPILHPEQLIAMGVWSRGPLNWDTMAESARYFRGRQVLVRAPVISRFDDVDYMRSHASTAHSELFVTHRAQLLAIEGDLAVVEVEKQGSGADVLQVPVTDLLELNQPHRFCEIEGRGIRLEDSVWCQYNSTAVRAKLVQIALVLEPLVATLDFSSPNCIKVQQACVRAVRGCLDIVSFKSWRGVVSSRTGRAENVAKLAIHGQGHCHGVSSTMAAFLYPFTEVLGIDLKYRGGFTFYDLDQSGTHASNTVERHQWLELTFRPSMESCICDLWLEDADSADAGCKPEFLTYPIQEAYSHAMYPNGTLILNTKVKALEETDISF